MTLDLQIFDAEEGEDVWVDDATAFDYTGDGIYIATIDGVRYFTEGSIVVGGNSDENDNSAYPERDDA